MNKKQRLIAAAIIICIFVVFQYFKLKPYYFEQNFSDVGRAPLEEMEHVRSFDFLNDNTTLYNESGKKELINLIKPIKVLKVKDEQMPELDLQYNISFTHFRYAKDFWFDIGQDLETNKEYLVYIGRNGKESYYQIENQNIKILDGIKKISENDRYITTEN